MFLTLNTSAKNPAPIFSIVSKSSMLETESTASLIALNIGELGRDNGLIIPPSEYEEILCEY